MKIEKVALIANTKKPQIEKALTEIKTFFLNRGIAVVEIRLNGVYQEGNIDVSDVDFALSLGGDGTVLSCADICKNREIPILAVNMGTFGYLAETSVSEYAQVFEEYLENGEPERRMRVEARVERDGKTVYENSALNEFTVSSALKARIGKFNLSINGTDTACLRADGIIFATPSGSTAYNLSAGGPILDSGVDSIIINPICPFTMGIRPLVVSGSSKICIDIPVQSAEIALTCDGHSVFSLKAGDKIFISKSRHYTCFVKNRRRNFIEILRDKLGWAGGLNA